MGYGIKIFVPRPLHYVTRSPGNDGPRMRSLLTLNLGLRLIIIFCSCALASNFEKTKIEKKSISLLNSLEKDLKFLLRKRNWYFVVRKYRNLLVFSRSIDIWSWRVLHYSDREIKACEGKPQLYPFSVHNQFLLSLLFHMSIHVFLLLLFPFFISSRLHS